MRNQSLLFILFLLGILWQGGQLFWFGIVLSIYFLAFLYVLFLSYHKPLQLPHNPLTYLILLFWAWCGLTVFWSITPSITLNKTITLSALPLGLSIYYLLKANKINWQQLWQAFIAVGMLLFILSSYQVITGQTPRALFFNPNTLGAYLNLILFPTAAYFLCANNKQLNKLSIVVVLMVIASSYQGSRGVLLGQLLGLALLTYVAAPIISKKRLVHFYALFGSGFLMAAVATNLRGLSRIISLAEPQEAGFGRWQTLAIEESFTFADQGGTHMGKRCQIARCPHRTLRWDHWDHPKCQHLFDLVDDQPSNTGCAAPQRQ